MTPEDIQVGQWILWSRSPAHPSKLPVPRSAGVPTLVTPDSVVSVRHVANMGFWVARLATPEELARYQLDQLGAEDAL